MTNEKKKKKKNDTLRLFPVYHAALGRAVPTTKSGRVRLANGPLVLPDSLAAIETWQADAPFTLSLGAIVDQLVQHAQKTEYAPK